MNYRRIEIEYNDGTNQNITIDEFKGVRFYPDENYQVAHFGRDDGHGWRELVAAPLTSIKKWG